MRRVSCWAFLLVMVATVCAEEIDPERMRHDLVGSVVSLRQPLRGMEITFDSNGTPVPPVQRGSFARDGLFRIDDLKVEGRSLLLNCHRVLMLARADSRSLEFFPIDEKARIIVVLASRDADSARHVLDNVFRQVAETETLLGNYARAFGRDGILEPGRPVMRCKLQPINRPAPYGPASGRMVAKVIVNERGEPEAIGVVSAPKSKGDTKVFVETLWNWRFAPFLKNGKPTSCTATIGLHFENPYWRLRRKD